MLRELLASYVKKKYFGNHHEPVRIGVYRPSVLSWSCIRKQFNYYQQLSGKTIEEIPDNIVLLLAGGIVFHRLLQSLRNPDDSKFWDKTEVECSLEVEMLGEKIQIVGHADAIRKDEVYEFKHTRSLPSKPQFPHILQLNFYLGALGKIKGRLVYTGYDAEGGLDIREFPWMFSEWHLEHLIARAQALHILLVNNQPPRCSCRDKRHEIGLL